MPYPKQTIEIAPLDKFHPTRFSCIKLILDEFHGHVSVLRTNESMFSRIGGCKAVVGVRNRCHHARCYIAGYHPFRVLIQSSIPITVSRTTSPQIWIRGLKPKVTIRVEDLPQGPLPSKAADTVTANDGPAYPTVIQQARNNMRKFAHCVVLTRVGNFFEVYQTYPRC